VAVVCAQDLVVTENGGVGVIEKLKKGFGGF
jgi:hypothetical protein